MSLKERREIKKLQRRELKNIAQKIPYDENDNILLRLWPKEVEKSFYIDGQDDSVSLTSEFKQYLCDFRDNFAVQNIVVDLDKNTKPSSKVKFRMLYQSFFKYCIIKTAKELKKNAMACLACFLCGLLVMAIEILIDIYVPTKFKFLDIIPEILAWVFIWEAFDMFFFKRTKLNSIQRKNYHMYKAEFTDKEPQLNIKEVSFGEKKNNLNK